MMRWAPRFSLSGHIVAVDRQVGRWIARKLNTKEFYIEIGAGKVIEVI
jgi:hypothetical protein